MRGYALALMFVACAAQAEPALTNRATDVLVQPQSDASKLASLAKNDKVEVLQRSGAWSEVKTSAGKTGWIRMMHLVPAGSGADKPGSAAPSQVNALAGLQGSGRTSNNATVTTGVRGLRESDLQRARPNPEEFQRMQKHAVAKEAGLTFAQRNRIASARVEYLQDTEPASNSGDVSQPSAGL